MKFGFVFPGGDARAAADAAHDAEKSGWDGFFVWEPVWGVDAWVSLTAAAMRTKRIRLGTMLSPLSRMRPWDMAGKSATLDRLSGGRVILSVGLGAVETGFEAFGEVTERKTRAELLDEGLDILTGLWKGQPFAYEGKHYRVKPINHFPPPPPAQQPRIPIWVVGAYGSAKSLRRAARYDGLLPTAISEKGGAAQATPEQVREMKGFIEANRPSGASFDIIVEGQTPGEEPEKGAAILRPWLDAGATWWIEAMWSALEDADGLASVLARIRQGPPHDAAS